MGHATAQFAVADDVAADDTTRRLWALATGDWAGCSAAEQAALAFARKLTINSSSMSSEDLHSLSPYFGVTDTLAIILCVCHCLGRAWCADVFQLDPGDVAALIGARR
jgi:hypothetical protein